MKHIYRTFFIKVTSVHLFNMLCNFGAKILHINLYNIYVLK